MERWDRFPIGVQRWESSMPHDELPDATGYHESLEYLYGQINYERVVDVPYDRQHFRLSRMQQLLDRLGNPHLSMRVVHVAGTKGKGSFCWLLADTLQRSGMKVGLYTSPHLTRLEERWMVDGRRCSPSQLVGLVDAIRSVCDQMAGSGEERPTFFEMTTAMAWLHFRNQGVEAAVMEVGLGGRLDSTNVCHPDLTVITSISYDHRQQLGNTLARIASEKAGIIKDSIPLICGASEPDAAMMIEQIAAAHRAPIDSIGPDFDAVWNPPGAAQAIGKEEKQSLRKGSFTFFWKSPRSFPTPCRIEYPLGMLGRHQANNGALVIAAVDRLRSLGWQIPEAALRESLATTQVPARLQTIGSQPWRVLDTAHNEASLRAMIEALDLHFPPCRKILLFSSSRDKDYGKMLELAGEAFDEVILTRFTCNPRAVSLDILRQVAQERIGKSGCRWHDAPTPLESLALARSLAGPDDLICVAGSFFLASELMAALEAW
jgi:dihydrofolate synthase/folylpolyglutamate synthase